MVRVKIGDMERELANADAHWINQQINRRRADGQMICVRINVNTPEFNMGLATPTCESSGYGGRLPLPHEKEVFDLWKKKKLDSADFTGGNLVAFLNQLKNIL